MPCFVRLGFLTVRREPQSPLGRLLLGVCFWFSEAHSVAADADIVVVVLAGARCGGLRLPKGETSG